MDDRITAYTPRGAAKMGLDGVKLMFRIDLADDGSGRTLEYCARTIDECNDLGLPVFLEPLPSEKVDGVYRVKRTAADNIKQMGVASALGYSSLNTWLKIQYTPDFERVVQASSLPLLMLGGESKGNPTDMLEQFHAGMASRRQRTGRDGGTQRHVSRALTIPRLWQLPLMPLSTGALPSKTRMRR